MDTTVKLKLGFAALMIASGIGVAMYPVISNAVAQRHASSVIESYNDTVQTMDTEKIAAKEAARRYNEQLSNAIDRDAAGEAADTGTSYVDMLDVGESLGYITIPKIDVNLPIYEGTSDDVLLKGVGHLEGSSYPLGGAGTQRADRPPRSGRGGAFYRSGQVGRGRPLLPAHYGRGAGLSGRSGQGRGAGTHRGSGNYPRRGLLHAGHLHALRHQYPPYACARHPRAV